MCDKSNIRLQKTNIFDTFSANSLKILDKSTEDFRLKYIENLYFTPDNKKAKTGQNLHNFLCFYLNITSSIYFINLFRLLHRRAEKGERTTREVVRWY